MEDKAGLEVEFDVVYGAELLGFLNTSECRLLNLLSKTKNIP